MKKKLYIIGGGSCALFLATAIDTDVYDVTLLEHNAALGRKFLVAGDGGLNLTHSEDREQFISRYTPSGFLKPHFEKYDNQFFMRWLEDKGIPLYIGSSGRVFPKKGMKPVQVLEALIKGFAKDVRVQLRTNWKGFSGKNLLIEKGGIEQEVQADVLVFCLGGSSWSVTGSTGSWRKAFTDQDIRVDAFEASNCRFILDWPSDLLEGLQGKPVKNCSLKCADVQQSGEFVITKDGIEGGGVYPLSAAIRGQLLASGKATISVDLKPQNTYEDLLQRLTEGSKKGAYTDRLRQALNLTSAQLTILKALVSKEQFLSPEIVCAKIKALPFSVKGLGPIEDAISTVGGIALDEIDAQFQLKKMPHQYVIGEMLNYDAPTGGYLLQSCFSMAMALAEHLNSKR